MRFVPAIILAAMAAAMLPLGASAQATGADGVERCHGFAAWGSAPLEPRGRAIYNLVHMKSGMLHWNGHPADVETLKRYFAMIARLSFQPITAIDARGMDCTMAEQVRLYAEESLRCTPELCRFAAFEGIDPEAYVPPAPPAPPAIR